jgi:type IV pilus assembly protein PilB
MATNVAQDRLGDLFVREGLITEAQLSQALAESKKENVRLGYALVKLGFVAEEELTRMLSKQYRVPAVDLEKVISIDPKIVKTITPEQAYKHLVLPLRKQGAKLTVAMTNPTDLTAIDDLRFITKLTIEPVIVGEFTLRKHLEKYYGPGGGEATGGASLGELLTEMNEEDLEFVDEKEDDTSVAALQAQVEDAPVVKFINGLLTDAVLKGVSDIHIEPFEKEIRVRYRKDGRLQEVMKPPMKMKAAITSRIKILSDLNIAERRVPQDGRIKLKMKSKVVDFRVSTLPVIFGEKIVMRILDKGNLTFDLTKFGFEKKALDDFMWSIERPYGMVLVTGPTGSGKTTTLYSALSQINTIDTNIMTAEDPVEYNLYGINQVLVRTEIGMTFAAALKAFLRQDPNIIMLGEIRDIETGGIAIKAALTGHLVLSTLHTNDCPSTITRLLDMGLEPFNVASALNLLTAQRLVRKNCPKCVEPVTYPEEYLKAARVDLAWASKVQFMRGKGCDNCGGSGSKGRTGVYEVLRNTTAIRKAIMASMGTDEIRAIASSEGTLTLREDGLKKVERGITSLEEVIKETTAVD